MSLLRQLLTELDREDLAWAREIKAEEKEKEEQERGKKDFQAQMRGKDGVDVSDDSSTKITKTEKTATVPTAKDVIVHKEKQFVVLGIANGKLKLRELGGGRQEGHINMNKFNFANIGKTPIGQNKFNIVKK